MPPPEYSIIKGIPESQDRTGANVTPRASGKALDAPVAELPMRPRVDKSRPAPVGVEAAVEPERSIRSIVKRPAASTGLGGQEGSPTGSGQPEGGLPREASAGGAHSGGGGKEPPALGGIPGEGEFGNEDREQPKEIRVVGSGASPLSAAAEEKSNEASSPFSTEWLSSAGLKDGTALYDATIYMQTASERILGEDFDLQEWNSVMRSVDRYEADRSPHYLDRSDYAASMLRAGRELANRWKFDGADPALQYIAFKTFLAVEESRRARNGSGVMIYQLSEDERELIIAEPSIRNEVVNKAKERGPVNTTNDQEARASFLSEKLAEFAAMNNLQEQVPILDEIAGIALLERTIQERRLNSLLETVSLEPKRIITEGQQIGLAVKSLRTTNKISTEQLAEKLQIDQEILNNFESGSAHLDLNRVKVALLEFGVEPGREENVEKMNQLEAARQGQNLLRDLAPEDISIFQALDLVRLSTMLTEEDFAVAAGIPVITLRHNLATRVPELYTLIPALEAAGIPLTSKEAQLIFLKRDGLKPFTVSDLEQFSSKDFVIHFRSLTGFTQEELKVALGCEIGRIVNLESGTSTLTIDDIPNIASWLGLSQKSALIRIMEQRVQGKEVHISDDDRRELVEGPFVTKDYLDQMPDRWLSSEDRTTVERVDRMQGVASILNSFIGNKNKGELREIARQAEISLDTLYNIRSRSTIPQDQIIVRILNAAKGYDFDHPVTRRAVTFARQEKRIREYFTKLEKQSPVAIEVVDAFEVAMDTGVGIWAISQEAQRRNIRLEVSYLPNRSLLEKDREQARQEREWLVFMTSLEPSQVVPSTSRYLVAATLQSARDFRQESGIKEHRTLTAAVSGTKDTRMRTLNAIIDASPIDSQGKVAQDLRVKGEPWSVKQLEKCTFGDLLGYVETLKGMTHEALAEALGISPKNINEWLLNRSLPRNLDEEAVKRLLGEFQNDELAHIIIAKSKKQKVYITQEVANKLLLGDYLFAEHFKHLGSYTMSAEDNEIFAGANRLHERLIDEGADNVLGRVVAYVRRRKGIAQKSLGGIGGNEQGRFIPQTHKQAEHAVDFGYKLPHPIARLLVDLIEEEKIRKAEQTL